MDNPIEALHSHAPLPDHIIGQTELQYWDTSTQAALVRVGFLAETHNATYATCFECHSDHSEPVIERSDGSFALWCPDAGTVDIPSTALRQWTLNQRTCAHWLGEQLGMTTAPDECVPGRVFHWSRCILGGARYSITLVRGLEWPDGATLLPELNLTPRCIVLSLGTRPALPDKTPIVYAGTIWNYLDYDEEEEKLLFEIDYFIEDIGSNNSAQKKPAKKAPRKKAQLIDESAQIKNELIKHICSVQHALRDKHDFIPAPSQSSIAKLCGLNRDRITRCKQHDPRITQLFEIAADPDQVRSFNPKLYQ